MKEIIKKEISTVKVYSIGEVEIDTKENFAKIKLKEEVNTNGQMERDILVSGIIIE